METDDAIYFFGKNHPQFAFLSNFYPCEFSAEGVSFASPINSTEEEEFIEGEIEDLTAPNKFNPKAKRSTGKTGKKKKKHSPSSSSCISQITYISVEQCYVHQKFLYFDPDNSELLTELFSTDEDAALKVKKIGRRVENFDENLWAMVRYEVMRKIIWLKFSQNPKLARLLLKTGNKVIYESSPHDAIWGIGYGPVDAQGVPPTEYGLNLLGRCLMEVRERLRRGSHSLVNENVT